MQEVKAYFQKCFGTLPVHLVQAPGRLELLGNHTDYNEGLVMSVAVDRHVFMASAPRHDGRIELASSAFPEREIFYADKIVKNPAAPWANYIKGVLLELRQRGVHFTGFNAAIHASLPMGAGLSSSAALEIVTALTIRRLFPFSISQAGTPHALKWDRRKALPSLEKWEKLFLAKICQAAECNFAGANVGLLDQISCLFGRAGHVIEIDCRHLTVAHEVMPPGISIVVCNSGVQHDLAAGGYNELRGQCESAARKLGVTALRSVDTPQLQSGRRKLSQREYECARHVVGENARVSAGARALREGDVEQFGQFLFQSHASSRDSFKNSCEELDFLVELARDQPGCFGARLTGGGFGGATINLVRRDAVPIFAAAMTNSYAARMRRKMNPVICQIVDGAS